VNDNFIQKKFKQNSSDQHFGQVNAAISPHNLPKDKGSPKDIIEDFKKK
jgi:hypothetical protein